MRIRGIIFLVMIATCVLPGCVKVEAWQKGNLAKGHMAFEPDPLESKFVRHTYESKEASAGGYGIGGGGCGCN